MLPKVFLFSLSAVSSTPSTHIVCSIMSHQYSVLAKLLALFLSVAKCFISVCVLLAVALQGAPGGLAFWVGWYFAFSRELFTKYAMYRVVKKRCKKEFLGDNLFLGGFYLKLFPLENSPSNTECLQHPVGLHQTTKQLNMIYPDTSSHSHDVQWWTKTVFA